MCWKNVKLIWLRELRDQLRDRRTLFTVVVLPLLLYPFMGISLIQITQFFRENPTRIWIVGRNHLPETPPLIVDGKFNSDLVSDADRRLTEIYLSNDSESELNSLVDQFKKLTTDKAASEVIDQFIQRQMLERHVDLAIIVPKPVFADPVQTEIVQAEPTVIEPDGQPHLPSNVFLFTNSASDKSRIAYQRAELALQKWQSAITNKTLTDHHISMSQANPIRITHSDVAQTVERQAAAWSKTLPLLIMIWCLTGAFYPAIDLVAGEKERGTFETLLSSPANRSEIALGKLLTVVAFSMSTALLNLLSMGFTSLFVLSRISNMPGAGALAALGPPPVQSIVWLVIAIIPIATLFGAISLATAAFARSSKEGQYYLVPLIMASMPLMVLPMLPAAKLDIGSSLIPVTNFMLLLRGLIEGNYREVLPYFSLVMLVTMICVFCAVRWVVFQFNSENVLFRASERFGLAAWVTHIFRDREKSPALGHALLCGVLILVTKFFMSFAASIPNGWGEFAIQTVIVLVATVGMPALLMAIVLTRSPRKSLKLNWCRPSWIAASVFLAFCFHPLLMWFSKLVLYVYPAGSGLEQMNSILGNLLNTSPSIFLLLGVFAIAPAIIEEIAFRGFILSGAQSTKNSFVAVVIASLFFGAAHSVIQQSILTFVIGFVLGFIAIRTNSILPCIAYHATHNSMTATSSQWSQLGLDRWFGWLTTTDANGSFEYQVAPTIFLAGLGVMLLIWIFQTSQTDVNVSQERRDERSLVPCQT